MNAATKKKLRLLPVVLALLVSVAVWWNLFASDQTVLVFTTGSDKGVYHHLATELKNVIEANHPDVIIRLRTSAGSNENIARLDTGEAQLGVAQNDVDGGKSVRSITGLHPEVLHLICRTDAGIHCLSDLSGHRIGIGPAGSGTEQFISKVLLFAKVKTKADETMRAPFGAMLTELRAGNLDAAFFLTGLGADIITNALSDDRLVLAPIQMEDSDNGEAEAISRKFTDGFRVHHPNVVPQTIPLMVYDGRPTSPVASMSVDAVLVCQKDLDTDLVNRITRTLFEQRAVLSQNEPIFSHLDEQTSQSQLQFPLHQGAENYYRRKEPGFLAQNAELMGFIVTMGLLGWSIVIWAQRWYLQNRKNRIDLYYQAIDDVIRRLHDGTDLKELDEIESELMKIQRRASEELVQEELSADETFIIYQNMLNDCRSTVLRMREKIQRPSATGI